MADYTLPTDRAADVKAPTIVMAGDSSFPWMSVTARALAEALPDGEFHQLEGQTHDVEPEGLAPVLERFFGA